MLAPRLGAGALVLLLALAGAHAQQEPVDSPVIFVPGDGGSRMEAKLNKTSRVHYVCDLVSDWYEIWLNIHLLTPQFIDCTCDNLRMVYNQSSRSSADAPGVQVRAKDFGSLDSVDYLDSWHVPQTDYFDEIIVTLTKKNGYTRNKDMLGAAYDFRRAPNELDEFFANLTNLIQDTFALNNYRPVTLICHSMGCLNSLYLLNMQSQQWKDLFVRRLVSLAAPWDGSVKALAAMLYGDNLGVPLISRATLQALQSTFPSLMYLFPHEPTFARDRVLVQSKAKNFTLANLDELFEFANMTDQKLMWRDTRPIAMNLTAPGVELWCLYGTGAATPNLLFYNSPSEYDESEGEGDGTVNLESLRACERYSSQQSQPVYTRQFEATDHIAILRSASVAEFISNTIINGNSISKDTFRDERRWPPATDANFQ